MKYIAIILLCLFSFVLKAQQRFPIGFPTQFNTGWNRWGYGMTDSGLIVANRDTNWLAKYSGTIVFRPANRKFYYFDSTTLLWNLFGTVIDTTSLSNRINLKLNISDTTAKWWGIGKRWVDTIYRVNDSTIGYTIDNGSQQTFQILGRVSGGGGGGSGTVTSVGLSMPSAFSVSGSPITSSGAFAVSGAGTTLQYIRGNGTLATTDTGMIPNFYLKVRGLITNTSPITYNATTGAIGINNATTSGAKGAATFTSSFSDNGLGTIDLANITTAGNCINCQITFDAKGRSISYANGTPPHFVNASGAGDTLSVNDTLKRLNPGFGILHTVTATNITQKVDTSVIATQYDLTQVSNTLNQVLIAGNTASNNNMYINRSNPGTMQIRIFNSDTTVDQSIATFDASARAGKAVVRLTASQHTSKEIQFDDYVNIGSSHLVTDTIKVWRINMVGDTNATLKRGFQLGNVQYNINALNIDTLGRIGFKDIDNPTSWLHLPGKNGTNYPLKINPDLTPTSSNAGGIYNTGSLLKYTDNVGTEWNLNNEIGTAPNGSYTSPSFTFLNNSSVGMSYNSITGTVVLSANSPGGTNSALIVANSNSTGEAGIDFRDHNFTQRAYLRLNNANTRLRLVNRVGSIDFEAGGETDNSPDMRLTSFGNFLIGTTTETGGYKLKNAGGFYQDGSMLLQPLTAPPSAYNLLVHGLTDSIVYQVPVSSIVGNTIYTGNGTLAGNRTVTGSNNSLTFTGVFNYRINANAFVLDQSTPSAPYSIAVLGAGKVLEFGYTPTPAVYDKGAGIVIDTNNNVGVGGSLPTTAPLYSDGNSFFTNGFQSSRANFYRVDSVATNTTVNNQEYFFVINAAGGNVTMTLPAASTVFGSGMGVQYVFKRIDNSINTVTVQVNGSTADLIDGASSFTITGQYTTKEVQCGSATKWWVK